MSDFIQHQTRPASELTEISSGKVTAIIIDSSEPITGGEIRLDADLARDVELDTTVARIADRFPDLNHESRNGEEHVIFVTNSDGSSQKVNLRDEGLIGPDDDLDALIEAGHLQEFNRKAAARYPNAPVNASLKANILSIVDSKFSELVDDQAQDAGFPSIEVMRPFFRAMYPQVTDETRVKVVRLIEPKQVARPDERMIAPYISLQRQANHENTPDPRRPDRPRGFKPS